MVSPVLYEAYYSGAFLVREAPGYISRDAGVMNNAGGTDLSLQGGLVVSQNIFGASTEAPGTNTGNGTLGSITLGALALLGAYKVTFTSATVFTVVDPNGQVMKNGAVGAAYLDSELGFLVTAGGTAFAANDSFTITTVAGDGSYVSYTGALPAAAILYNRTVIPANTTGKKVTVISRIAEVNKAELQWDPAVTGSGSVAALQAAALASLAAKNIIAR